MTENSKKENKAARYWGFLVYPESVSQDWINILNEKYGFEWVCSPLHDKDLNSDGTPKKPHYHCLIYTGQAKKYYSQLKAITDEIKATAPQIIHNPKGNIRYMLHMDNPEKAQYNLSDLKAFNGFDIEKYIFTEKDLNLKRLNALNDIYDFIEQQGLTEFHEINTYARKNEPYWFELINTNSAYAINLHLKSIRHSLNAKI